MTAVALDRPRAAAAHAAPSRRRPGRLLRFLGGTLLALATVAAMAGAGAVVVYQLGFSPVLSPSMVPAFGAGDLVVTRPIAAADVAVGDVVVLPLPDQPGQRYVHRVTGVTVGEDGRPVVTTRGDANSAADPWALSLTSEQVPAVVGSVPRVGTLALHTRGSALRIPLLVLVAGCVLLAVKRSLLDR